MTHNIYYGTDNDAHAPSLRVMEHTATAMTLARWFAARPIRRECRSESGKPRIGAHRAALGDYSLELAEGDVVVPGGKQVAHVTEHLTERLAARPGRKQSDRHFVVIHDVWAGRRRARGC